MKPSALLAAILATAALTSCTSAPAYDASGIFEATETTLSALSSGRILTISADEGDSVRAGDCLALTDTTQLSLQYRVLSHQLGATRSSSPDVAVQLASLRSQIAHQKEERLRLERLMVHGAATSKQLDDITSAIDVLERDLSSRLSTLGKTTDQIDQSSQAIAAQMAQTAASLADCRIISPVSGTVTERYAQPGEFAQPGKALLKVADLDHIYLRAYFTSDRLADLTLGMPVTVTADFGGGRRYDYSGHVAAIATESEFTPKNIQTDDSRANLVYAVKIAVDNPDGRIKIGGYGHVKL